MNQPPRPRLRALPHNAEPTHTVSLICKRPSCPHPVVRGQVGRPAEFCSTRCQQAYRRERDQAVRQLREATQIAAAYDVTAAGTPSRPRSSGSATDAGAGPNTVNDAASPGGAPADAVKALSEAAVQMGIVLALLQVDGNAENYERAKLKLQHTMDTTFARLAQLEAEQRP